MRRCRHSPTFSILDAVLRLLVVLILQVIPYDKLIIYAILVFAVQTVIRIIYGVYCSKNFPEVHTRPSYDKKIFKEIFAFSGWTLNGYLAGVCRGQGLNIVLNLFFGPTVNAARGLAVRVQSACSQFSNNFLLAARPQITKSYAQGDLSYMHKLFLKSTKFGVFIVFFIALPLSLEADQVLVWWLGIVPEHTTNFLRLILFSSLLKCMDVTIVCCVHATGNLKKFQLIEGTMLLSIVPISYVLLKFFHTPPESVFIVDIVVEIVTQYARMLIVLPMIKLPLMDYVKQVVVPILLVLLTAPVLPILTYCWLDKNVWTFFVVCIVSVICSGAAIYVLGCTPHERQLGVEKAKAMYVKFKNRKK